MTASSKATGLPAFDRPNTWRKNNPVLNAAERKEQTKKLKAKKAAEKRPRCEAKVRGKRCVRYMGHEGSSDPAERNHMHLRQVTLQGEYGDQVKTTWIYWNKREVWEVEQEDRSLF